jgi:hypothetical protein
MSRRFFAALASSALLIALCAGVAYASSTENLGGDLNRDGSLVQYQSPRTHTFTGAISLNLNDNTCNVTRLGLRNEAGSQFTNTEVWSALGTKSFHLSSNGSTSIAKGTRFYMNGRMNSCWAWQDNHWGGIITY